MLLTRKLERIVATGVFPAGALGSEDSSGLFQEELLATQKRSNRLYMISAVMIVILFVVLLVLMVVLRENAAVLAAVGTVCGTSIFGLIVVMTRIAKEVAMVGLLLALASKLPPEDVSEILRVLLDEHGPRDPQY